MNLYHYFEKGNTPFLTLSDLSDEGARKTQDSLKENDNVYARRDYDGKYMSFRRTVENNVRSAFIAKGGTPVRKTPIYFILGESHEKNNIVYREWFKNVDFIEIPINELVTKFVSFTYGDSFIENHPEHRDQTKYYETVHTYEEILEVVQQYGWPQDSVKDNSPFWVPRYIEAQLWSDDIINKIVPYEHTLQLRHGKQCRPVHTWPALAGGTPQTPERRQRRRLYQKVGGTPVGLFRRIYFKEDKMSNSELGKNGGNRGPGLLFRESAFFKFAKPYFDYLRKGKIYSLFYWAMALFSLLIPFIVIFFVIESGFLRYSGAGIVVAFIFGWLLIVFSSWIGFQLWWNRETALKRFEGADFIATPVVSDIVQTFGEWLGTFTVITGAGFGVIAAFFLRDSAVGAFSHSGYGFLKFTPFLIIAGPVLGFFIVLLFRFLAEQIRIFAAIANNTKEIARNSKK